jgi:hypothetical protein
MRKRLREFDWLGCLMVLLIDFVLVGALWWFVAAQD